MIDSSYPKVSIIVPVYNVERYLRQCIDSVLDQTYGNWEMIIVDDGSTDGSAAICDEYAEKNSRIRVFHKPNCGPSSARNAGMAEASGDYLIFLDSDDFWLDDSCLSRMIQTAVDFDADLVRGDYARVHGNGIIAPDRRDRKVLANTVLPKEVFFRKIISGEYFIMLFLIKRSLLGGLSFDESMDFQEDIDFIIRMLPKASRCVYRDLAFYGYRQREGSLSRAVARQENLRCSFLLSDRFRSVAASLDDDKKLQWEYYRCSVMMYHWTLQTLASNAYYTRRRELIERFQLKELRKRVLHTAVKYRIVNKSLLTISVPPAIGLLMFRVNDFIKARL